MRPAAAVVAVSALATLALVAVGLAGTGARTAGTDSVGVGAYVAFARSGQSVCQPGLVVPAGAVSIDVFAGVFGRPGPPLRVAVGGRPAGRRDGGYRDGWVGIPLTGVARARRTALLGQDVCIVNRGRGRLALGGTSTAPFSAPPAHVGRREARGAIALRWRLPEGESRFAEAGTIADRVTFGKADFGPWAPAVLLVLVWAGSFALVLRAARA